MCTRRIWADISAHLGAAALLLLFTGGCGRPEPTPDEMLTSLDALTARLRVRPITDAEFQETMAPWQPPVLRTWLEPDLEAASLSAFRLRTSLVQRYQLGVSPCADDREVVWDVCGGGFLCATMAVLGEVRCIWSNQVQR